jgi:hypothetical protein
VKLDFPFLSLSLGLFAGFHVTNSLRESLVEKLLMLRSILLMFIFAQYVTLINKAWGNEAEKNAKQQLMLLQITFT